jgi:hypothetical protein
MLSAGFMGSAYWSFFKTPVPYPLPFWLQPVSLLAGLVYRQFKRIFKP